MEDPEISHLAKVEPRLASFRSGAEGRVFSAVGESLVECVQLLPIIFPPSPNFLYLYDLKFLRAFHLYEIRHVEPSDVQQHLDLIHVHGRDLTHDNVSSDRALDLNEPTAVGDAIGRAADVRIGGVDQETEGFDRVASEILVTLDRNAFHVLPMFRELVARELDHVALRHEETVS